MKKLCIFALALLLSMPALADNVTIVQGSGERTVQKLPGNAQIVTGDGDTVIIRGDDDVWRNMLLGPRVRYYGGNAYGNGGGYNSVSSVCPPTLSTSDRNKCIRDFAKAQEKIRKRYND